jgi:hypothetical protein
MMRTIVASFALLFASVPALHARTPPAPDCLDARDVQLLRQVNNTTLLLATTEARFRVDLVNVCAGIGEAAEASLLAAEGWLCGAGNEYIRNGEQLCGIRAVTPIGVGEYSILARIGTDGTEDVDAALPTLEVEAEGPKARRRFAASTDYCVNPRHVTGWNYSDGAIVLNVTKRAGGAHSYRLKLGTNCPELGNSDGLQLHSGVGIGLICGNPGDVARAVPAAQPQGEMLEATFVTRIADCPIVEVFAME